MSQLLTTAEIAQMRVDIEKLLPDTCNVLSLTTTDDGQGHYSEAWGTATANAACRLDVKSGREQLASGAYQTYSKTMLSIPQSVTITTANQVEHGSLTYDVKVVNQDASWLAVKRAELEVIR